MGYAEKKFVEDTLTNLTPEPSYDSVRPRKGGNAVVENFGKLTFEKAAMANYMSKSVYNALMETIERNERLNSEIADEVAHAMKEWAISLGATHFCHWFQPVRGVTAEKHDAFLSFDHGNEPIQRFSGRQLTQGEPDASSFPSGGRRSTFEARGYTAWDPTSPAFIMRTGKSATLAIPSVFLSWTGEALDMKTPLLRALSVVEDRAFRLIKLFGNRAAKHVRMTCGPEQEYFLISKDFYEARPDLMCTARTLIGAASAKDQQMEDHYFGSIKPKVLDFMADLDARLFERGIPAKTRHNEVAPNQFELAVLYEEANLAVDHNLQAMEIMRQIADEHGFALLLHEKPFAGINGSGKHLNWSLTDSEGNNLLSPGANPKKNIQFLTFIAAILAGTEKFGGLLRCSVADAGNDHRLGANEAPPAVMSVYLGEYLNNLLNELVKGKSDPTRVRAEFDLGLKKLPQVRLDNSDRNRTSPIAFTGDKFEFRAVGASQSTSEPATVTALMLAYGIDLVLELIEEQRGGDITTKALKVIKEITKKTERIRFEGNNYEGTWLQEAQRRGLPGAKDTPTALETLTSKDVVDLYRRFNVLSAQELHAKQEIRLEAYIKTKEMELTLLKDMAATSVIPVLVHEINAFGAAAEALKNAKVPGKAIPSRLKEYGAILDDIYAATETAEAVLKKSAAETDTLKRAHLVAGKGVAALAALRDACDRAQKTVDHTEWPYPIYREMLFLL